MGAEDNAETKTILLVEDDNSIAAFTSRVLELEGYRILQTPSAAVAIEKAQKNHIDLVLLDLMLADTDEGWKVLERIKETPALRDIPVIVYSAAIEQLNQERAYDMGAAAFLTKPVGAAELRNSIISVLTRTTGEACV